MEKYYRMNIAGCERDLPLCPLNEKLMIGAFVIFGDPELTVNCAAELFGMNDIDGGLVGGASLKVEDFSIICNA